MQPLNKEEISFAAEVVKNHLGGQASTYRFETIQLVEPSHEEVSAFQANKKITRSARVVVYRFGGSGVNIFEVLLTTGVIIEEKYIESARPMIQFEEFIDIENAVKEDDRFIEACKKRGIYYDNAWICSC